MRLLSSLLLLIVFCLFLAGVGFYFTREYFLYRGVENFKKSVLVLQRESGNSVCTERAPDLLGLVIDAGQPTTQIRFTSDTEYLLEVLCPGFAFDPVTLEERELDRFVTKVAGSSGIMLGEQRTGVELSVFAGLQNEINAALGTDYNFIAKNKSVALENNQFIVLQPEESLGVGPVASCQGFGYQCCQADSQQGVGEPLIGAVGCEQSCYSSCARIPLVLSLNSNPFFDVSSRTLTISSGESVDFAYVVDMGASDTAQVTIDFGDGESEVSEQTSGSVNHVFGCLANMCQYTVSVMASDSWGMKSVPTDVSQLDVIVTGGGF